MRTNRVVRDNSAHALRGCTVVLRQHASEPLTTALPDLVQVAGRRDALIGQTLVRPFLMIVIDKCADGGPMTKHSDVERFRGVARQASVTSW